MFFEFSHNFGFHLMITLIGCFDCHDCSAGQICKEGPYENKTECENVKCGPVETPKWTIDCHGIIGQKCSMKAKEPYSFLIMSSGEKYAYYFYDFLTD